MNKFKFNFKDYKYQLIKFYIKFIMRFKNINE